MRKLSFRLFFIGFNKCGTRSLADWLGHAGVHSIHGGLDHDGYHDKLLRNVSHGWPPLQGFDGYDAYLDVDAVRKCFRELDRNYPGSKFVLNTRNMERWVRSRLNHDAGAYIHFLNRKYDVDLTWSEWAERWRRDFLVHEKSVTEYFAERPADLLRFNVETDSPSTLAAFLGLDAAKLPSELPREGETPSVKHYDFSGGKIMNVAEVPAAVAERDRANELLKSVIAERESAIAQFHAVNGRLETVIAQRDHALSSRDALFAQRGELWNQCVTTAAELDAVTHKVDSARYELASVKHELDSVKHELDSVRQELDLMGHELDLARRERDALIAEREAMLLSRSWRVTAPLRNVRGWIAKLSSTQENLS